MTIKHSFTMALKRGEFITSNHKISLIIDIDKITFYDTSRDIAGTIDLEENDIIVKAIKSSDVGACRVDLVKSLAETRTINRYDNGNHKWFNILEAEKLFEKDN